VADALPARVTGVAAMPLRVQQRVVIARIEDIELLRRRQDVQVDTTVLQLLQLIELVVEAGGVVLFVLPAIRDATVIARPVRVTPWDL